MLSIKFPPKVVNLKLKNLHLLHYKIYAFLHFTKCRMIIFLYSLSKNNRKVLNQIHKDFNEKIENNFGLHKTDYSYEYTLKKQHKSCNDLKQRIRELESEMMMEHLNI